MYESPVISRICYIFTIGRSQGTAGEAIQLELRHERQKLCLLLEPAFEDVV